MMYQIAYDMYAFLRQSDFHFIAFLKLNITASRNNQQWKQQGEVNTSMSQNRTCKIITFGCKELDKYGNSKKKVKAVIIS